MKHLHLLLLFLFFSLAGRAQIAFYDAGTLLDFQVGSTPVDGTDIYALPDADEVFEVLKNYVPPESAATKDGIVAYFSDNPFIRFDGAVSHGGVAGVAKSVAGAVGGIDVTKFANAIGSLMIDRAKQELTISFFNRFRKFAKEHEEFQTLFPKTTDNLSNLLSYTYPQMLPVLRDGFYEDMGQITYHLEAMLELTKYQKLLQDFPEVQLAVNSLRLVHDLENGTFNAAELITRFAGIGNWSQGTPQFKNTGSLLKMADIISGSLRVKEDTQADSSVYVNSRQVRELVTDGKYTRIYMGLIYQQIKMAGLQYYDKDGTGTAFTTLFSRQKENVLLFQNRIAQFVSIVTRVNAAINKVKNAAPGSLTNDDYYDYINTSLESVDYVFSLAHKLGGTNIDPAYMTIARKSNDLYRDIYRKQYTQAVNNALDILEALNTVINKATLSEANKATLGKLMKFTEKVKPYALFMANVIEAKTESDVQAALENVILPVGSSSIKKNTLCNISIQSYLGAFLSLSKNANGAIGAWSDRFGVTAPIGLSFTPSFLSWQQYGALSIFGSVFDLGAIVDYKLQRDSTYTGTGGTVVSKDYSVKLGQILSPGLYLVYGAGANLPLSLGFGGQYGPGLSKIETGNNEAVRNPSWRWNFFLAVDIPFFTLKNRVRNRQMGR